MNDDLRQDKAKKRVQEILSNADKGLIKPMSYTDRKQAQEQINKKNDKIHRKERKQLEKEMRDKPKALVFISNTLSKLFHIIVTLWTIASVVNIYFVWQIYKAVSAANWQAIFQTKYSLYIVAYVVILFVFKTVYYQLYKYANT